VFWEDKDVRRSPLRHLLKSNATPSDSEVITIRALITDAEASIEELHRRFPVRDHASQVTESQLLKSIEAHRALLSPVRHLPSEILQEIFFLYADNPYPNVRIATMPWRLGHISHRWRKIALSLPSLWDNIPKIYLYESGLEPSHFRALFCLLRRSGTSPTLKLNIIGHPFGTVTKVPKKPTGIIKEIMLHSERIEQLRILVNDETTMHLFQGFKGRLPNLRILRVRYYVRAPNLDVFENAPALRQVAIAGTYRDVRIKVLLPWSQITHFEEELPAMRAGILVPLSSLRSLTNLDIYRPPRLAIRFILLFPYRPTTLPNLRTLRVVIYDYDYEYVDLFLKSLTIPAVEVMKILYMAPLIPHLVSIFSGCRGPSRLQKLAFRTIPTQTGELSALLKLTPHLVELDIDVPPVGDLLRLIYGEGEVMLVPILQALYMRIPMLTASAQIEHLDTLAQVRCELDNSDDATLPSLGSGGTRTRTTLHTLRFIFDSAESRDTSQKILNNWSSSFTLEETEAIYIFSRCCNRDYIRDESFIENILSCVERYEVTNKVLHVGVFIWMLVCGIFTLMFFIPQETNLHIKLRHHFIGVLMKLPDEDKLKQRVMDILAEWDQLLLNDFSGGRWAKTSSELFDFSLVYVSKSKFHGELYVSV
jgi:hypothetical protein